MANNANYSTWPIRKSKSCPSVHGTLRHEPQPYVSYNPIHSSEIEKLLSLESEHSDNWNKIKKTKDGDVWRRESTFPNTPAITKTVSHLEGIPYMAAVQYLTDLELRRKWDKTFACIDVLEKHGQFQVLYCSCIMPSLCKNREMILASIQRRDHDQNRHIQAMCSILHPSVPVVQPNNIRAEVFTSGMIIRGVNDGLESSEVTIINQIDLRGTAPQFVKNSYLAENALDQMRMMKRYYRKHHAELESRQEKERKVSEASYHTSDSDSPEKFRRYKQSRSVDDIME